MATVTNIRTAKAKGPKVPRAYTDVKDGRDLPGTHSSERPHRNDDHLLTPEAELRLERAASVLAAGAIAITLGIVVNGMHKAEETRRQKIETCIEEAVGHDVHVGIRPADRGGYLFPGDVGTSVVNACQEEAH